MIIIQDNPVYACGVRRSLAIEKAYVHDVYEQISANFSDSRYRAWPRVKQFLMDLEPGSFVCDVGKPCSTVVGHFVHEKGDKYITLWPLITSHFTDSFRSTDPEVPSLCH